MNIIPNGTAWQILAFSLISCSLAYANPSDPTVISGSANFTNSDAKTLSITTSDKAVIHWRDFSIAENELAQFVQPSSKSIVVNKVSSELSSVLLGSLKANGRVFLINPSGILIGENASVDTNGFIASTLPATSSALLDGTEDVLFQGSSTASIVNMGTINAWDGDVFLIGYQIDNKGAISAPNGTAALGASQEVLLKPQASEKIVIRPSLAKYENDLTGIDNSGAIAACKAELKADGNAYAMAIQHKGSIDALGLAEQNGEVFLVADGGNNGVHGSITASNADQTGGSVQILGDHIALLDNALVDASGEMGGGTVLIGGDKSGANPSIWNAKTTYVDQNAVVRADALIDGNGGKVITWADETTCFYGTISARGGENSGDGGFVEVSGKLSLDARGATDRLAPHGKAGILLLDPFDITIGQPDQFYNTTYPVSPYTITPNAANSQVSWAYLTGAMGLGGGPTVVNTASGGGGTGTITVSSAGSYNSSFSLTLDNTANATTGNIVIDGTITNSGLGDIIINSFNNIDINFDISTGGNLTLTTTPGQLGQLNVLLPPASAGIQADNITATIDGDINITAGAGLNQPTLVNATNANSIQSNLGNINITGGTLINDDALLESSTGAITITAPNGSLTVKTGALGNAAAKCPGLLTINVMDNVVISSTPGTNLFTTGYLQGGDILINAANLGMRSGIGPAMISTTAPGNININLTNDLVLSSIGNSGFSLCYIVGNAITITTPADIILNGSTFPSVAQTYISGYSTMNINAQNVIMNGNATQCFIYTMNGPLNITAANAVMMNQDSQILIFNLSNVQPLLVKAGTNIVMSGTSEIYNQSHGGSITLVVDNLFPNSPTFGPGAFLNTSTASNSVYTTGGGPLWIFTSQQNLNNQSGKLNGLTFTPGPYNVNTSQERWDTYYNNTYNGFPFTVFYKGAPSPILVQTATTLFNTAAYEFLQELQNYDVFWYWRTAFNSSYDNEKYNHLHQHEGMTSSDVLGKNLYRMLRKSYKEQNGKVINLIR